MKSLRAEVADHFFKRGKLRAVYRERLVFVLIINVQINSVGGNLFVAKGFFDFVDAFFRLVTVARLLEAQRPQRRQFRAAHQRGKVLHDFGRRRPGEKVIVDFAAFGTKRIEIVAFLAEVESAAPGVVEENAISEPFAQADKERDGLVKRIRRFAPCVSVSVPHGECAVAPVHRAGFVAQTVVALVFGHLLPNTDAPIFPAHGKIGIVGNQHVADIP